MGMTELGTALRDRRKSLRITQRELATYADISHNTVYKIERGQGNPTLTVLFKLLDVLGFEMEVRVKMLGV